jgi:DNA-binding CsgD family transcriptional regulator
MINSSKITQNQAIPQTPGLFPSDDRIEFYGNRTTKDVFYFQNGQTHHFTNLPSEVYQAIKDVYLKDAPAMAFLSTIHSELTDQIKMFTYFVWGGLDDTPDWENGKLSESENFLDSDDCPSLLWQSKAITIDRYILKPRDRVMIKLMAEGHLDFVIAEMIDVSVSHYDKLKRDLFNYTNTNNKTSLVLKAKEQKVI